jgi:hypothetical protein
LKGGYGRGEGKCNEILVGFDPIMPEFLVIPCKSAFIHKGKPTNSVPEKNLGSGVLLDYIQKFQQNA